MILYLSQKLATCLLAKFVPLSKIMVWGSPKRHTIFCQKNLTICCLVTLERHCLDLFGEVVDGYQEEL